MTYPNSPRKDSLRLGEAYQDIVANAMDQHLGWRPTFYHTKHQQYEIGESVEGVEVKLDVTSLRTRRLSIEVGEKTRREQRRWAPSGIMRNDNTVLYAVGNTKSVWIFKKATLRQFFTKHRPPVDDANPPTIQCFYLPIQAASTIAEVALPVRPSICEFGAADLPWTNCQPCPLLSTDNRCLGRGVGWLRQYNDFLRALDTNHPLHT